MSEFMVERVARALREGGSYEYMARAAMKAMREPTVEMLKVGIDNCATSIKQDRAGQRQMTTPFDDECGDIYRAMIDEALK